MAVENRYFSGQGCVLIGPPGTDPRLREVGNAPTFNISLTTETLEHKEAKSGSRLTDARIVVEQNGELTLVLESVLPKNLALALYGETASSVAAAGVTKSFDIATPPAIGDILALDHIDVSNVSAEDSAGVPVPLVLDTDYRIHSAAHGTIEVLSDWSTFTGPIVFTYDHTAQDATAMFKTPPPERAVVANLLNTADSNAPHRAELYRVLFNPLEELVGISDEFSQLSLTGAILLDDTKPSTGALGQFGRWVQQQ